MPARKLSDADVAELVKLHAAGSSLNDLSAAFDISAQHAGRIVRRAAGSPVDVDETLLTVDEVEVALAKAVRRGSIGAIRLWLERHGTDAPADDDPFAEFDAEGQR